MIWSGTLFGMKSRANHIKIYDYVVTYGGKCAVHPFDLYRHHMQQQQKLTRSIH